MSPTYSRCSTARRPPVRRTRGPSIRRSASSRRARGASSSTGTWIIISNSLEPDMDGARALLRHTVATVAYRGGKAVRGAPASFAAYSADGSPRTPSTILAHIGDLFDWALSQAKGAEAWADSTPLEWDREVD